MKKLVSLLLALSLVLALTACGQKDTAPDTTQTDDPQAEQAEPFGRNKGERSSSLVPWQPPVQHSECFPAEKRRCANKLGATITTPPIIHKAKE